MNIVWQTVHPLNYSFAFVLVPSRNLCHIVQNSVFAVHSAWHVLDLRYDISTRFGTDIPTRTIIKLYSVHTHQRQYTILVIIYRTSPGHKYRRLFVQCVVEI